MAIDLKSKRILIVSNNPLDIHSSNGKTMESFFKGVRKECLAQVYLNNEIPNSDICNNFYRINEKDILRKILLKETTCGNMINNSFNSETIYNNDNQNSIIPKNHLTRICREFIWKTKLWNNKNFNDWILEFDPDMIFFCAGDSCFAYDIVSYIRGLTNARLITYITDDYILPQLNLSVFFWIRRNWILKKMKDTIKASSKFITISEPMRIKYMEIFKKDSFVSSNMADSLRSNSNSFLHNSQIITLVYTGGLHYGRYETLGKIGKAIKKYNEEHEKKAILKIYCPQTPNTKILKKINIQNGSVYCGSLNQDDLKKVLNACDYPVHVESFRSKNINRTRLSISTKITEYLSLGKCIIAIGPSNVASMMLLKEYGFCIEQQDKIYDKLTLLFEDETINHALAEKAKYAYTSKFNSETIRNDFLKYVNE